MSFGVEINGVEPAIAGLGAFIEDKIAVCLGRSRAFGLSKPSDGAPQVGELCAGEFENGVARGGDLDKGVAVLGIGGIGHGLMARGAVSCNVMSRMPFVNCNFCRREVGVRGETCLVPGARLPR